MPPQAAMSGADYQEYPNLVSMSAIPEEDDSMMIGQLDSSANRLDSSANRLDRSLEPM